MPLFGKDAVAYLATADLDDTNTAATATWNEVDNIQDETDNFSADEVDITTRASAKLGWNATAYTVKQAEVRFTFLNELDDDLATALTTAFFATSTVPMMFLSGDVETEGSSGLAANWAVSLTFNRAVKGVQTIDAVLKAQSAHEYFTSEGA